MCIYCAKNEGTKSKAPMPGQNSRTKRGGFPDLIQLFLILVLTYEVLAIVGLLIVDLRALFRDPPGVDLTMALPITAVYDSGRGAVVDEAGLRAMIHGYPVTYVTFKRIPDAATVFLLFFHAYKTRLISLAVIILLILFYRDVQRGRPFFRKNLNRLNIIAVIIILLGPVDGLLGWWIANIFIDHLHVPTAKLVPDLNLNLSLVLWGMIILAVVQIIKRGIALQEEQDLTI
jgi:hypothetical protein